MLEFRQLSLEVGLLRRDLVAQSFKSLLPNVGFFSRGSPALDRVVHSLVGKEKTLRARGPAGVNAQGVNDLVLRVLLSTR